MHFFSQTYTRFTTQIHKMNVRRLDALNQVISDNGTKFRDLIKEFQDLITKIAEKEFAYQENEGVKESFAELSEKPPSEFCAKKQVLINLNLVKEYDHCINALCVLGFLKFHEGDKKLLARESKDYMKLMGLLDLLSPCGETLCKAYSKREELQATINSFLVKHPQPSNANIQEPVTETTPLLGMPSRASHPQ